MAGNEWINGYLEAILDAGAKLREQTLNPPLSAARPLRRRTEYGSEGKEKAAAYSPTKYFVEEVVSRFDDADLHKTWVKAVAKRNSQERNNRLENLCWRIWHLARKKKQYQIQIELEDARQLEQGRKEAAEDISELSEGEKEKGEGNANKDRSGNFARINSDVRMLSEEEDDGEDETKNRRLYIVLVSLHGLVRGENMELGRDSDTGGQVKYVVELARALAATKGVYRVDLLTRQISSPDVDWTYGEPVEMLSRPSDSDATANGDGCGAYIFVDRALAHITNVARALGEQPADEGPAQLVWPYAIHGHYADGAEAAARLAGALNVPAVVTGHSLGRNKLDQLLKMGLMGRGEIDVTYRIARRIEAEEAGLDAAQIVVTSTRQEVEEQWGLYDGFDLRLERKLRVRRRRGVSCLGRYMPRMVVIPPGMDFSNVTTQELVIEGDGDLHTLINSDKITAQAKRDLPPIWTEIMRFFTNPHKPMILALSRPDPKKNVVTLLKAFGECRPLRELANLSLILGNREDIEEMSENGATVLTTVLKLIDRYDLYGHVAYPKHHTQSDVPRIYRLAAKTKGVFINPALVEPFGLTLIEALNNGLLVDPHDPGAIADALLKLLADKSLWLDCRRSGLRNIRRFSWPHHCRLYLSHLALHCPPSAPLGAPPPRAPPFDDDEPLTDSLRALDSIRFSVDGPDLTHSMNGTHAAADAILDALRRHRGHAVANRTAVFSPGRRQLLLVIAADCYGESGHLVIDNLKEIIEQVMDIGSGAGGRVGYVFSSGSTLAEVADAMRCCDVDPKVFDALICSSGAELCYPWRDMAADAAYGSHVEFRWPAEHVKSAVPRLAKLEGAEEEDMIVDEAASSVHCYAYSVKPGAKVRKVDGIRQRLRMRGFRCNLVYTQACSRLNVVPLFASRPCALRYLSIQWGIDLSKVVVYAGEKGDTDHERLLPGLHKTIIFRGLVSHGSERLLRDDNGYKMEDVAPLDSPNIIFLNENSKIPDIMNISPATNKCLDFSTSIQLHPAGFF
ncbi:putative sucrose-phosphate synthase 4, partial [Ananas comosus]